MKRTEPLTEDEERTLSATIWDGFCVVKRSYKSGDEFFDALRGLLATLERERERSKYLQRRINEMRNAMPEMLNAMSDLQKKWAFTFRGDQGGQP